MSHERRKYLIIWVWLLILVGISIVATSILPKAQGLTLIFVVAGIKAVLVARHYMHLKGEKAIIYAMALIPLAFIIIFLFALFPDFVLQVNRLN